MSEVARVHEGAAPGMDEGNRVAAEFGLAVSELRPLLEGARARGFADALEMLGQGAILIDETGAVLHLSSRARAALGGELLLAEGHLLGADATCNHVVEGMIASVLAGGACEGVLCGGADSPRQCLQFRAVPMPGARGDHAQLLKAVIFLSKQDKQNARAGVADLAQACAA